MVRINVWLCTIALLVCVLPMAAQQPASTDEPGAAVSGSGTTDFIPIWTNSTTLGSSVLFQSGKGAKAKVGIGTTKPASTLDVKGGGTIRGLFSLPATGTATTTTGFKSQPMNMAASVFNSTLGAAINQNFQWQAAPVGNDTGTATGLLNLLYGPGTVTPTEILSIASNGQITFAAGQTFPGAGTVTSVGSGLGLTGGPITTSGTLAIDTSVVPQLAANNAFTGSQTISGAVSVGGSLEVAGFADLEGRLQVTGSSNFSSEAVVNVGNSLGLSVDNTSSTQTLQLQNFASASTSNFIEADFDNGKDVFQIDTKGDTFAAGTKSAVVPLRNGEMVDVFSMESPEVWFEDFGSGRLSGGAITISLDPKFAQTVNLSSGYHVFLTPKGDCKGLFVTGETNRGFEVRELSGGKSSVEFDYRIVAHRNGYEAERLPVAILAVAAKPNPAAAVINKKK
jgi:hypothetical protein